MGFQSSLGILFNHLWESYQFLESTNLHKYLQMSTNGMKLRVADQANPDGQADSPRSRFSNRQPQKPKDGKNRFPCFPCFQGLTVSFYGV